MFYETEVFREGNSVSKIKMWAWYEVSVQVAESTFSCKVPLDDKNGTKHISNRNYLLIQVENFSSEKDFQVLRIVLLALGLVNISTL